MEFEVHLEILKACRIYRGNITIGALIRAIFQVIEEHKGKDFKDIDDFFSKLYPEPVIQPVHAGVNVRRRRKRENPFYDIPDMEET